jgi:hypothetical protein
MNNDNNHEATLDTYLGQIIESMEILEALSENPEESDEIPEDILKDIEEFFNDEDEVESMRLEAGLLAQRMINTMDGV